MWIKLHDYECGMEIVAQTQNICTIEPFVDSAEGCSVSFVGSENNYIRVKETVDEIEEMIAE